MQKSSFLWRGSVVAVLALIFMFSGIPAAQSAVSFKGKVAVFVVGFGPGGGTDLFSRMIGRHIGRHLPGKPSIVIRNMGGAQGMIAANYVYAAAKPNGLTLFACSGSNVMANILRPKGVVHKLEKMHPIYSAPIGSLAVVKPGMIKEPKDIMNAKGLIFGHTGPTGGSGSVFLWARELLGFPVDRWIWGYDGSGASRRAFLSGEINTNATTTISYWGALKAFVDKGEVVPVFQSGILDENRKVVREPAAPDIPTAAALYEQVKGKKPSGSVWRAYKLIVGQTTFGKALLLPPKVPADVVAVWRKAAIDMTKDPKFLKDAAKLIPNAPHMTGRSLAKNYPSGVSGPPDLIRFMRKVLEEKHNVIFE
jgi:tripartite-type tricarboxylate transporter receptor subunit TctC